MITKCEGTEIRVLKKFFLPSSLGFFYSGISQFIGFDRFGEEYKVMGLAAYGSDEFPTEMDKLLKVSAEGYELNTKYFKMHSGGKSGQTSVDGKPQMDLLYTNELTKLLGDPGSRTTISSRERNIAKSMQVKFENVVLDTVEIWNKKIGAQNIVTSGGCALNGVTNTKIALMQNIKGHFIHPAAGDDGTSVGAAYAVWHDVLKQTERHVMRTAYLGGEYEIDDVLNFVKRDGFYFDRIENDESKIKKVAKLLSEGNVIGWFQGRSEWGPRALGNRSILASPLGPDIKDKINAKIKRREGFRPFAPSVLEEDMLTYFEHNISSPFMMHVVKFRDKYLGKFPAIEHVDGTGRIQTVTRERNQLYYDLISEFKKLTGVGMLLNTSFNENEPVVETPLEAYSCFKRNNFDILIVGDLYIHKKRND